MTSSIDGVGPTSAVSQLMQPTAGADRPDPYGKDTFLKLLVAQLKYQDPSSPVDSAQFMAQTAQFQMVEKLNDLATQSASLLAAEQTQTATNLVGRTVTYTAVDGTETSGAVSAVRLDPAGPVLTVGTDKVALSAVKEVSSH